MDVYQYVVQTIGHEKTATSAWRDLFRNGTREVREAIAARMPNAVKGLTLQSYNATKPAVQAVISAPSTFSAEHLARDPWARRVQAEGHRVDVTGAFQGAQTQAIKGGHDYLASKPSLGLIADAIARGDGSPARNRLQEYRKDLSQELRWRPEERQQISQALVARELEKHESMKRFWGFPRLNLP